MKATVASVFYGPQEWKKVGCRWYVRMFGTSGPGQGPHWFWGEVEEHRVPNEVKKAFN